jgi:CspA family cold shock protein
MIAEDYFMSVGRVTFFDAVKGFGFVCPDGAETELFVHMSAVKAAGMNTLKEGQRLSFDVQVDARGSKAINLKAA